MANTNRSNKSSASASKSNTVKKGSAAQRSGAGSKNTSALKDEGKRTRHDEIGGIIMIAAGIILGAITYIPSDSLFGKLVPILFGIVGVLVYALPIILIAMGIAVIAIPRRQIGTGLVAMCYGIIYCVMCIIHLASHSMKLSSTYMGFGDYIVGAYNLGKDTHAGGGVLAAMPAYAIARLITVFGAIVLFSALIIIFIMLITRVSLRSAGRKVVQHVEFLEDKRKARLYNESIVPADDKPERSETQKPERRKKVKSATSEESIEPHIDKLYDKRTATATAVKTSTKNGTIEGSIDVMPTRGKLPKAKRGSSGELKTSFNISNAGMESSAVGTDQYAPDPFDTIEFVPQDNITGDTSSDCGAAGEAAAVNEHDDAMADVRAEAFAENADTDIPPVTVMAEDDIIPEESFQKREVKASETSSASVAEGMEVPPAVAVYQFPPISLLRLPDRSEAIAGESPTEKARILLDTLASFNISAKIINISVGPAITRFELQPAQGIRVNRITTLSNDIALALAAPRVRIEAPIPGKAAIGIEIPNKDTAMVRLREVLEAKEFTAASSPLTFALGKDIAGKPVTADLQKMPHMLIAGATGSGKSVCINGIIVSLAYKSAPEDVRMVLIDPKVVELSVFSQLPHLFCPVVTDPKKAAGALKWAVLEMEQRYAKMGKVGARDLARYNSLQEKPEDKWPRLVIIIDELADLMMVASKDVEEAICRIAQLGRACGIHLIVATQRPSVDVITGLIKANIPSRVAFAVSNAIDSRVILDTSGAEKLLGKGDMLFHSNGAAKPIRAQGSYVSDEEVEAVMNFFIEHRTETTYDENVITEIVNLNAPAGHGNGKQEDELLPDAVRIVLESGSASISMIQRRLRVGYARAARLVDIMEQQKIVSGFDGSKPRKVLIDEAGYMRLFGNGEEGAEG